MIMGYVCREQAPLCWLREDIGGAPDGGWIHVEPRLEIDAVISGGLPMATDSDNK